MHALCWTAQRCGLVDEPLAGKAAGEDHAQARSAVAASIMVSAMTP